MRFLVGLLAIVIFGYLLPTLIFAHGWRNWALKSRTFLIKIYLKLRYKKAFPILLSYEGVRQNNAEAYELAWERLCKGLPENKISWKRVTETDEMCQQIYGQLTVLLPKWALTGMCYFN